jgi:hypothetical protein
MRLSYHGIEIEGESFLTVGQIAMMLRISEANLEAFLETHILPARWIGGDGTTY